MKQRKISQEQIFESLLKYLKHTVFKTIKDVENFETSAAYNQLLKPELKEQTQFLIQHKKDNLGGEHDKRK